MFRNIMAFVLGAVLAAGVAVALALASPSSATTGPTIPRTGTLPVNRWVAEPGIWARGAWQIAPDLVIYRKEWTDKTGSTVAKLTKEAIFGVQ
ncbi:MAG: hypothetical protein ACK5MP_09165 [Nostocoides sp.]